jgi:hypothetical protein
MMIINVLLLLLISIVIIADDRLIEVAQSPDYQWNRVALTKTNRTSKTIRPSIQTTVMSRTNSNII